METALRLWSDASWEEMFFVQGNTDNLTKTMTASQDGFEYFPG